MKRFVEKIENNQKKDKKDTIQGKNKKRSKFLIQ